MTFVEALIGLLLCISVALTVTAVAAVAVYFMIRRALRNHESKKEGSAA